MRGPVPRDAKREAQRTEVPPDPGGEVVSGDVVQLATERRHLTDVMIAYQAETDLVHRITPYHRADDEMRTLIHSVRAHAGDLAVTDTERRVTFAPLSPPQRTAVLAALCPMGLLAPRFPRTRLHVRRCAVSVRGRTVSSGAGD